ncbi:IclR family transcriptional regulator [Effusibacillus pohliae]|nr:IclR family transcriptional regulator C-terminal domain-containing protein [Effusibacillus pohliae]
MLDGRDVVYLAKEETTAPIRLASSPGMRFPAHATALGKALLSQFERLQLEELYRDAELTALTPNTVRSFDHLWEQLQQVKARGTACEQQEAVEGFCCVAAPVFNHGNRMIAAVSFTMLAASWHDKQQAATEEIADLARRRFLSGRM